MLSINRLAMITAAALCIGVVAVHVADQGGVSALADPSWIGWGYRLVEVGALLVAAALLLVAGSGADSTRAGTKLVWLSAVAVGAGPFIGYVLSRTLGLPQDSDDVGNWADPVGTASLVIEGLLVLLAIVSIVQLWRRAPNATATATARGVLVC